MKIYGVYNYNDMMCAFTTKAHATMVASLLGDTYDVSEFVIDDACYMEVVERGTAEWSVEMDAAGAVISTVNVGVLVEDTLPRIEFQARWVGKERKVLLCVDLLAKDENDAVSQAKAVWKTARGGGPWPTLMDMYNGVSPTYVGGYEERRLVT